MCEGESEDSRHTSSSRLCSTSSEEERFFLMMDRQLAMMVSTLLIPQHDTYVHTYTYIYIYVCVCVCLCGCQHHTAQGTPTQQAREAVGLQNCDSSSSGEKVPCRAEMTALKLSRFRLAFRSVRFPTASTKSVFGQMGQPSTTSRWVGDHQDTRE